MNTVPFWISYMPKKDKDAYQDLIDPYRQERRDKLVKVGCYDPLVADINRTLIINKAEENIDHSAILAAQTFKETGNLDEFNNHMAKVAISRQILAVSRASSGQIYDWAKGNDKAMVALLTNVASYIRATVVGGDKGGGSSGPAISVNIYSSGDKKNPTDSTIDITPPKLKKIKEAKQHGKRE